MFFSPSFLRVRWCEAQCLILMNSPVLFDIKGAIFTMRAICFLFFETPLSRDVSLQPVYVLLILPNRLAVSRLVDITIYLGIDWEQEIRVYEVGTLPVDIRPRSNIYHRQSNGAEAARIIEAALLILTQQTRSVGTNAIMACRSWSSIGETLTAGE